MRELPLLNDSLCTACGDCVALCPVECLELKRDFVWIPRPRDCVRCELCVSICPEGALKMSEWVPA
jgi:ferredoxin